MLCVLQDKITSYIFLPNERRVLSYDVASGNGITPCIKINKPLVVYSLMLEMLCADVHDKSKYYGKIFVFSHK